MAGGAALFRLAKRFRDSREAELTRGLGEADIERDDAEGCAGSRECEMERVQSAKGNRGGQEQTFGFPVSAGVESEHLFEQAGREVGHERTVEASGLLSRESPFAPTAGERRDDFRHR